MAETIIAGHYLIQDKLGAGGMGTVFLGQDTRTSASVAIKQLKPDLVEEAILERFKREGEALRELNHPNIVKMLDAVEEDGKHYLIMEYVAGGDLADLLQQGEMPLEQILTLSIDLADALTRAHKLNIIHRDLKPANVLIGDDGILHLTDFGVAHVGNKERITDTDAIIGTIDYLPPETFADGAFDTRGDIWAFGVVLFEMLTGKHPFGGDNIIQSISTDPISDLESTRPDISPDLTDLVYRMLERDPQARIPSVRIVGAELEAVQQGRNNMSPSIARFETPIPAYSLRPRHNLPAQTTPFVGREDELLELAKLIADDNHRLITVLAPGGMGKTRLALEAAASRLENFVDGVYFVDLTPLEDSENINHAIVDAMSFSLSNDGRTPKQQLLDFLANKQMLLVIDNWEHLIDGADLVSEILQAAPDVSILATSRRRLEQTGESLFHISGMDFPQWETPEDALNYAAIKLFVNSAVRAEPRFELTRDNVYSVARICRLVAGMPLGIVLAASWLGMLSPEEIAEEITNGIDFLEATSGDIPERQRSIQVVFDYSWDLLTADEQAIFMKLSIFRGGFSRQAAQSVTGATLRQLMTLSNKSLLRRNRESGRYSIHELARQYAFAKLEESGEIDTVCDTQMRYYVDALIALIPKLKGGEQLEAFRDLESDFENVRVAWYWAQETRQWAALQDMVESIWMLNHRGNTVDIAHLFVPLMHYLHGLQRTTAEQETLIAWLAGNYLTDYNTPFSKQEEIIRFGLKLARKHDSPKLIAYCLDRLAVAVGNQGRTLEAEELLNEAFVVTYDFDDLYLTGKLFGNIAIFQGLNGDMESVEASHLKSCEIARQINNKTQLTRSLGNLAALLSTQNKREEAHQMYVEALQSARETRNKITLAWRLGTTTASYIIQMQPEAFGPLLQELDDLAKELNSPQVLAIIKLAHALVAYTEERYDENHDLLSKAEQYLIQSGHQSVLRHTNIRIGIAKIMVDDFNAGLQYLKESLPAVIKTSTADKLLLVLPAFIHLLDQQNDNLRRIALVSLIMNHPHSQPIDTRHPYMLRIQSELEAKLDGTSYQAAWEQGKSLDLAQTIQDLLDGLCEIYEVE